MKKHSPLSAKTRIVIVSLILALLVQFSPLAGPGNATWVGPQTAEADFLGALSNVVPFAGLVRAFKVRNRVYTEANAFIDEEKDYHARLQAKAREMWLDRDLAIDSRSQTGSYMKVSVLIDQERRASLDFAEAKKKAAREEFLDKFEKAILTRVINSGAAQELIKAMSAGIRAAQGKLGEAVDQLTGESGGALGVLAKVRRQAGRLQALSGAIGGRGGRQISRAMGKIVGWYDRTTGTFTVPINQVNDELGVMSDQIESLKTANFLAGGAETPSDFVIRLVDAEEDDPVLDAILGVLDSRSGGDSSIREEARQKILIGFIFRCAKMGSDLQETLSELMAEMDPNYVPAEQKQSRCQEVSDLLTRAEDGTQTVDELIGTEEETSGEESGEPLRILSLETKDGWCFPKGEHSENHICGYTVSWKVEYASPFDTVRLRCVVKGVDYYKSETFSNMTFQSATGVWEESMDVTGFYPEVGEYTELFFCGLYNASFEDEEMITRVETDIVAPLTTIREP